MNQNKILRNYVSDLDKFLNEFNKTHDVSATQRKEIDKHRKISQLRDTASKAGTEPKHKLWEGF